MKRITRLFIVALSFAFLAASLGCERKPEDLEEWRNAKGGVDKIQGWAVSEEEPEEVRIRAVEILVEDNHYNALQQALDDIEDDELRTRMVDAALPIVEEKWAKQDMPELTEELKEQGGQIEAGQSESVEAKDAAYYLHPYASEETQKRFESILAEWLSTDWQLRDQLGRTTLGQVAPLTGDEGRESLIAWVREAVQPHKVMRTIDKHGDEQTQKEAAEALVERARAEYPELRESMQTAVFSFEHKLLVPFLEEIIEDEQAPNQLVDRAMNALVRIQGERAAPFFSDLVKERRGTIRWVAATRLVEVMGKSAFVNVGSNLPVTTDSYPSDDEEQLKDDVTYFCNMYKGEMEDLDVTSVSDQLTRGLESSRWPARVLALQCARTFKANDLEDEIAELSSDSQQIPDWGERQTVGGLADEVIEDLSKS